MNRLTRKIKGCYCIDLITCLPMEYEQINKGNACVEKLGKLEDLEEEIGIDLITLFKALKQKYVYHQDKNKIELLGVHIKSDKLYLYGFVEDSTIAVYLDCKDYGKTWTLTKEEVGNE